VTVYIIQKKQMRKIKKVKSQGGVVDIEDVITSLFLKPTACRSPETRTARGSN